MKFGGFVLSEENQAKVARGSLLTGKGLCTLGGGVIISVITVNCLTALPTCLHVHLGKQEGSQKAIC